MLARGDEWWAAQVAEMLFQQHACMQGSVLICFLIEFLLSTDSDPDPVNGNDGFWGTTTPGRQF